jgi:superfamily I DNA/RNA helicase/RecB family exonuclease
MHDAPAIKEYLARPPGHSRVLGPPASGKTTLLVERWRALKARGHRPGIVAFGREHRDRLLERIVPPGGAHLGAHPVTTHALVASAVLDAARPRRARTLRDVDELLVAGRLLRREPGLLTSDLSAIAGSSTFLRDLLEALHVLGQNGVSPEVARACARACPPRARDVLAVYTRHREACAERGLVSFYDAAWRAAEAFTAGGIDSPLASFDVVLVDDFHDLDPGQYHLLTRLVPPSGATQLEVFGDPTGARFAFRGTSDRFLQEEFPKDYAPVNIYVAVPACESDALRDTVARLVAETSPAETPASAATTVSKAADLPLFAAAPVARDTIVARPACNCAAMMLFATDEIAEAQAVAARARAAIDAGAQPRDIAVVVREADRTRAVLEVACHEWGVPLDAGGGENGATEDLIRTLLGALGSDPDGRFAEALDASPLYPPLGGGLDVEQFVRTLTRNYGATRDGFNVEQLLSERVAPLFERDDTDARAAVAAIVDEWHRYREVIEHSGGGPSIDEFRATYLAERTDRAQRGNRVTLLSAREATGRSFPTVFVCGCAEGFFPGAPARDGYIPMHALARALEPTNPAAARDIAARLDESALTRAENALFLTALTRATHSLVITVPARIAGESTMPARVLDVEHRSFQVEEASRTESPCARAAMAIARVRSDEKLAERVRAIDLGVGWWVTPPSPERLPALASFSMSASKLNSYARCPRQFFYEKVLKMDRPESIYLKVGSLVHDALKEIIPPGATRDEVRSALRDDGTREVAERLVTESFTDAGAWTRELSVKYLGDMLRDVAELEAEREGNYRVRMLEEDVEGEVEGMPLRGRIDRVDDVEGVGPVVIDYKISGSVDKSYGTVLKKMESNYWQIPVYAVMATFKDLTPAAFVYYALPPGDESHATGVQLAPGPLRPPIPMGRSKQHPRFGPASQEDVVGAMAHAVEIHHSIIEGECRYERTENTQTCSNCHFAKICRRSKASL